MILNPETKEIDLEFEWVTPSMKGNEASTTLLHTIVQLFFKTQSYQQQLQGVKVRGYTEYTRKGVTFRCHPNYKNDGPWFDYAMFAWENHSMAKQKKTAKKG